MADRTRPGRPATGHRSRLGRYADPVLIAGVGLSLVLSIALDLTGAATGVESLLAGLMGTAISLIVDSTVRAERRFRWSAMVDALPWLEGRLKLIIERTSAVSSGFPRSIVVDELRRRYDQLYEEVDQLSRGQILRPRTDYELMIAATNAARRDMASVTNIRAPDSRGGTDWWSSDIGRHYWQTNLAAIARGVTISRIFIYVEMTDDLKDLVDAQRAAGVTIGLVGQGVLDPSLSRNFVIWDDATAWEAQMNAHGETVGNLYTVNSHDLTRLRNVFAACRLSANASAPMDR